jgi:type IV pilus assembly protein PilA
MRGVARRSRTITGFSPEEFLLVWALVGVFGACAALGSAGAVPRVMQAEILFLGVKPRVDWAEMIATDGWRGRVPPPASGQDGKYVQGFEMDASGAVNFTFRDDADRLAGRRVSLRPALPAAGPPRAIVWVCGNAPAPRGFTAHGENATSVPDPDLLATCRRRS